MIIILLIIVGAVMLNTTPQQAPEWIRGLGCFLFLLGAAVGMYQIVHEG